MPGGFEASQVLTPDAEMECESCSKEDLLMFIELFVSKPKEPLVMADLI